MTLRRSSSTSLRGLLACCALFLFGTACSIEPVPVSGESGNGSALDVSANDADPTTGDSAGEPDGTDAADEADFGAPDPVGDQGAAINVLGDDFTVTDPAGYATVNEEDCDGFFEFTGPPEGTDPECYAISVPADWGAPDDGDKIELPIAVFRAIDVGNDDAIVYLEGGPGGNSIETAPFNYPTLIAPLQATRDVVIFDQRGAGLSGPVLDCPEADEATIEAYEGALSSDEEDDLFIDAMIECRDRLSDDGTDLDVFHSVFSAIDTEAIRTALDFEPWNVLGISYGTRLGQTLMRMYPDGVRSVVLDSVVPVTADMTPDFAPNAERAFEQLFAGCEAHDECASTYPDFRADYFRLVDQWDAEPAEFLAVNGFTGDSYTFFASGDDLLNITFGALYSPVTFAVLPQLVAEALAGDTSLVSDIVSIEITNSEFISMGMLVSVRCHEEEPFEDAADIEALKPDDEYFGRFAVDDLTPLCDKWPAGTASAVEDELVVSDIPTLLMSGEYDPVTPPSGMPVIAAGLSTSWSAVFPHEGHGVTPSSCGSQIVNQFFDNPAVEPDLSCIAETEPPAFTPRSNSAITMVPFESSLLGTTISGSRPEDWQPQGFGVFARQSTIADPALLIIQPSAGLPPTVVLSFLEEALLWQGQPEETGELTTDAGNWSIYEGTSDGERTAVGFRSGDNDVFVGFSAYADEYDTLYETVFVPALEAVR